MHGSFLSLFFAGLFFPILISSLPILENLFPAVYLPTISFFFISISACNGGVEIIKTASGMPPLFFFLPPRARREHTLSQLFYIFLFRRDSLHVCCFGIQFPAHAATTSLGANNMHYKLNIELD
jgi:hypothetical protein